MIMNKSLSIQAQAAQCIPGQTQLLSKNPERFSAGIWPGYYQKAKGAYVWDLDGNAYLDMSIGGIGACVLGYADDEVDDAVMRAVRQGVACSLNCVEEVMLAETLCEIHPWAQMARFCRSGGEALSIAVRIARAHTKRDFVACCGYHGWNDWYLAANLSSDTALDGHLMPGLHPNGVPRALAGTAATFRYNCLDELEAIVKAKGTQLAAIVMEPVRAAMPALGFIEGVRRLADQSGAVLIMDEVSAGFRFCTGGAHMVLHEETPDMAVFSKALGNGYAISAVIGREDVMRAAETSFISSTNWTERIGPSAALACIDAYKRRKPYEKFRVFGPRIKSGWQEIGQRNGFVVHVAGMDAMPHFTLEVDDFASYKAFFIQCMLEENILASNLCYLMDAHTEEHVSQYLDACGRAFARLGEARDAQDIHTRLVGKPSHSGFGRIA